PAPEEPSATLDTDFTAAYLLEAVADAVIGKHSSAGDLAIASDPRAADLIDAVRERPFNTVVFVDAGLGPRKVAVGDSSADTAWPPRAPAPEAPLSMSFAGAPVGPPGPALDVSALVAQHRDAPLRQGRHARAALGDAAILGGAVVIGSRSDSST